MGHIKKHWILYAALGVLVYFWWKQKQLTSAPGGSGPPASLAGSGPTA